MNGKFVPGTIVSYTTMDSGIHFLFCIAVVDRKGDTTALCIDGDRVRWVYLFTYDKVEC